MLDLSGDELQDVVVAIGKGQAPGSDLTYYKAIGALSLRTILVSDDENVALKRYSGGSTQFCDSLSQFCRSLSAAANLCMRRLSLGISPEIRIAVERKQLSSGRTYPITAKSSFGNQRFISYTFFDKDDLATVPVKSTRPRKLVGFISSRNLLVDNSTGSSLVALTCQLKLKGIPCASVNGVSTAFASNLLILGGTLLIKDSSNVTLDTVGVLNGQLAIVRSNNLIASSLTISAHALVSSSCMSITDSNNVLIQNSAIGPCYAKTSGACSLIASSSVNYVNTAFSSCKTDQSGGGIFCTPGASASADKIAATSLTLSSVTSTSSRSGRDGGLVYAKSCKLTVANSVIQNSQSMQSGGSIYVEDSLSTLFNVQGSYSASRNGSGGFVFQKAGVLTVSNLTTSFTWAGKRGGSVAMDSSYAPGNLDDSLSGSLSLTARLDMATVNITSTSAAFSGGAIWTRGTTLTASKIWVDSGTAARGGGINLMATIATISDSRVQNCNGVSGGAIRLERSSSSLITVTAVNNSIADSWLISAPWSVLNDFDRTDGVLAANFSQSKLNSRFAEEWRAESSLAGGAALAVTDTCADALDGYETWKVCDRFLLDSAYFLVIDRSNFTGNTILSTLSSTGAALQLRGAPKVLLTIANSSFVGNVAPACAALDLITDTKNDLSLLKSTVSNSEILARSIPSWMNLLLKKAHVLTGNTFFGSNRATLGNGGALCVRGDGSAHIGFNLTFASNSIPSSGANSGPGPTSAVGRRFGKNIYMEGLYDYSSALSSSSALEAPLNMTAQESDSLPASLVLRRASSSVGGVAQLGAYRVEHRRSQQRRGIVAENGEDTTDPIRPGSDFSLELALVDSSNREVCSDLLFRASNYTGVFDVTTDTGISGIVGAAVKKSGPGLLLGGSTAMVRVLDTDGTVYDWPNSTLIAGIGGYSKPKMQCRIVFDNMKLLGSPLDTNMVRSTTLGMLLFWFIRPLFLSLKNKQFEEKKTH
jgi:hypothetical protein